VKKPLPAGGRPGITVRPMPLLEVAQLRTCYPVRTGLLGRVRLVRAVDGVSFSVAPGETLGLVGESGCGKSTLARTLLGLEPAAGGSIRFAGQDVTRARGPELRRLRRGMQMVFQDPFGSLNPCHRIGVMLDEVLRANSPELDRAGRRQRSDELLALVGLGVEHRERFPHQLSGGQRQRVGIARALAVAPKLLLADEPVSALDVSVQAQIIGLFQELQRRLGLACLFISHDLAVVEHLCRRVLVMYLGRIVEDAPAAELFRQPRHPYTRALLAAVPRLPDEAPPAAGAAGPPLTGDLPSPLAPPPGCRFHPRCPGATERCRRESPALRPAAGGAGGGHAVACHFA